VTVEPLGVDGPLPRTARCSEWDFATRGDPWFPDQPTAPLAYATAREECLACPVRAQCLAMVLDVETATWIGHGMVAGLTPAERAELVLQRRPRRFFDWGKRTLAPADQ